MSSLWQAPVAAIALVTWLTATPVSLADISRREALRRQATPVASQTFTNDDLPIRAPAAVSGVESARATVEASDGEDGEEAASAEPEPVKDEQWWRDRMAQARSVLAQNQALLATGQEQVMNLQAAFVSQRDPAEREQVRLEFAEVRAGVQNLKAVVAENEQTVMDIEAEAIEAGIPLEWVR